MWEIYFSNLIIWITIVTFFQFPTPDVPEAECDRIWREGKIEIKRGYEFRGLEMILYEFLGSGSAYLWEHRQSRGWSGCSDAGKWEKKSDGRCKNNARHIGTFESDCRKAKISGDGLWGQGRMERGGKEGDYLHNWPGSMMMITNIIIILQLTSWAIIGCTSFVPSCIKLFCLPELPQRRWWEAGWTHFAKWRSMPPQHHWILWLEHRPGILNHNVRCESTSWLIIFAQTDISQKCWRSLAFLTTQFDNFRITPASVTSTTLPKSTVWTLCGRWRGSTSTSTGGSLRWSPPVLLDRYPPIPAMSLSWCWFLSFFFSPLLTRWGRCTRRLQQASR